uniref:Uncharacterized protein n=1 Tax=Avena sativa TaxID=4498 RepID=A0ACD5ZD83_AVESA
MTMLQNIVEIHLFDCKKLQWLFSCDRTQPAFPNLKALTLESLVFLERWWEIDNDGIQGEEVMFPQLEKLFIYNCRKLTALPGHPTFPNLQNVFINGCPALRSTAKSPKLSVLNMNGDEVELFQWLARHMTSLTNLRLHSCGDCTETILAASENCLRQVVDARGKLNGHDFPLAVLDLRCFKSGIVTELCAWFVHLQDLSIWSSDALVHWPEKEFQGLVYLRKLLIYNCKNLTGYAQAPANPSTSSGTRQLLPRLESLKIDSCKILVEVFSVPASLRIMEICSCSKLESIPGMRLEQMQSEWASHRWSFSIPKVSMPPSSTGPVVEHLEVLKLEYCDSFRGFLHLPSSLKELSISFCDGLVSLKSPCGGLPSLERLFLMRCSNLSSIPDGPQSYSSLWDVCIRWCPHLRTLPASLQQQLGNIRKEDIHAPDYYESPADTPRPIPTLLKPKTWQYAIRKD